MKLEVAKSASADLEVLTIFKENELTKEPTSDYDPLFPLRNASQGTGSFDKKAMRYNNRIYSRFTNGVSKYIKYKFKGELC